MPADPAKLTPAQREALMWLPADGSMMMTHTRTAHYAVVTSIGSLHPNREGWLAAEVFDRFDHDKAIGLRLTPLGRAVRAVVEGGGNE